MIVADRSKVFLSSAEKGKPHEITIYITNKSDKEITVNTYSSCGCTIADIKNNLMQPEDTQMLIAVYTPPSAGMDEKEFGVKFTIDNQTYKLVISLIAKVI